MVNDTRVRVNASATDQVTPVTVVRQIERGEEQDWDRFVLSSPFGTFFHLSGWRRVVEDVLGHRYFPLVAVREGQISGVFPIARVRNAFFGDSLISVPLAVYGGICANDSDSYAALLQAGSELATRLGVNYLEMRNRFEPFPTSLPGRDLYLTFTQALLPGPEKLLQALPRDTRYAVRKSQKACLEWTEDLSDAEFYDIYAHSVHHLGTPVFPRKLFGRLPAAFPGKVRVFGVRKGKQAIAGVMCFYFRDTVMPYYGGRFRDTRRTHLIISCTGISWPRAARRGSANSILAGASGAQGHITSNRPGRWWRQSCLIGITWSRQRRCRISARSTRSFSCRSRHGGDYRLAGRRSSDPK